MSRAAIAAAFVPDVRWAERVIERFEAGDPKVRRQERDEALRVLGRPAGSVVRVGKSPRFDRMAVVAGD